MVEIVDLASARAWLEGKPRELQVAFAARACLRSLPFVTASSKLLASRSQLLHSLWMAQVSVTYVRSDRVVDGPDGSRAAFDNATAIPTKPFVPHFGAAFAAAIASANGAVLSIGSDDPITASLASIFASEQAVNFPTLINTTMENELIWEAAMADAKNLDTKEVIRDVFDSELWQSNTPGAFRRHLEKLKELLGDDLEKWDYWSRWYQGMLVGEPLPWDLQEAVVRIPMEV